MKVLHVINSLATGGAEKLLLDTIPLYNKSGITADVVVFQDKNYPFQKALGETKSCKIYNFNTNSVYSPVSIFKLMRILRKYDIVHTHLFPGQYFVVIAKILSFSSVKLVFTEHNTTNRRLENKIFKVIDKLIYMFYESIIAISPEIKKILIAHISFAKNKIHVIENGVAISNIVDATPLKKELLHQNIKETDQLIIQVAGFREQKDQETLIRAISLLPITCKLVLVGEGITKTRCQNLVKVLHLEERVFFLGIRTDIPQLLKTADIVVLSSHYEGMSLSSIEGMASGKPFIASNVPGLSEMVQGSGVLFEDRNEEELADIIIRLLEDESYYMRVASACVMHAKKFDIQIMVNKYIKLYKEICNE